MGPSCKFLLLNQPNFCHLKKKKKKKSLEQFALSLKSTIYPAKFFPKSLKKHAIDKKEKLKDIAINLRQTFQQRQEKNVNFPF